MLEGFEDVEPEEVPELDGLEIDDPEEVVELDGFEVEWSWVVISTVFVLSCQSTFALRFSETNLNGTKVRPFAIMAGFGTLIKVPFL